MAVLEASNEGVTMNFSVKRADRTEIEGLVAVPKKGLPLEWPEVIVRRVQFDYFFRGFWKFFARSGHLIEISQAKFF
ncbi:MAG: hypothetical protein M0P17_04795 [Methanoculleus sp.]|nr:hypothetical protein [Methanoculleus sp.]